MSDSDKGNKDDKENSAKMAGLESQVNSMKEGKIHFGYFYPNFNGIK